MAFLGVMTKLLVVGAVAVLLAVFINYPPPPLSQNLKQWMQKGQYFIYGHHKVFYIDDKGTSKDGPVLLCLHGFPTSSYDYVKVWPALQEKFSRVIIHDMLGFGFSDKPQYYNYTIMEQVDIVEALLTKLQVTEIHILSHDKGDTVAQELVARFNERQKKRNKSLEIKSLCLMNGGFFVDIIAKRLGQKVLLIPYLSRVVSHLTFYQAFKFSMGEIFGPNTKPTEEEYQDFWAASRLLDGHLVRPDIMDYLRQRWTFKERWEGALRDATIPMHLIFGPFDPVNPKPLLQRFKDTVPAGGITVLDDGIGHYPHFEAPSATMMAFFKFHKSLGVENSVKS